MVPKTALVTGGSSGLGAAICECLAGNGWAVFAGSRRGVVAPNAHSSIQPLHCDVTSSDSMRAAVGAITGKHPFLDAIVCNAGINVSAIAEELPQDRARAILETNFWGVVNGVRAALPHFRIRRKGTILVIGSLAGMVSPPGEAYYAASKHAVRGFLESLQYEVSSFGVRVHLIEPGFIKTNLASASPPNTETIDDYDDVRTRLETHWHAAIAGGVTPEYVARRIQTVLDDPAAPFRVRVGRDAVWAPRWKSVLPARSFFALTRRRFGLEP